MQYVSWWPRPAAWSSSNFDPGYWSNDAEDWYQSRTKSILNPSELIQLWRNSEWRQRIHYGSKRAPKLRRHLDNLAMQYFKRAFQFEDEKDIEESQPEGSTSLGQYSQHVKKNNSRDFGNEEECFNVHT